MQSRMPPFAFIPRLKRRSEVINAASDQRQPRGGCSVPKADPPASLSHSRILLGLIYFCTRSLYSLKLSLSPPPVPLISLL